MHPYRLLLAAAGLALVAAACGDVTEVTVTSFAPRPGDTLAGEPQDTVVVPPPAETVVSVVREPAPRIRFWSTETQPDRLEVLKGIIDRFTAASGIDVDLTTVTTRQLPDLIATNAAAGTLPDVVLHPLELTGMWAAEGLLDTEAAAAVVDALGPDTFSPRALELATVEGAVAAVPSDGWGLLLIYREDLFEQADLDVPDTFVRIEAAADELHDPRNDIVGIVAPAAAGDVATHQAFEHLALANGCRLVDDTGAVTLDAGECAAALTFYAELLDRFGPAGTPDLASARDAYLAGEAAMVLWPSQLLDELAGLDETTVPTCEQCEDDPGFLAGVSGIVPAVRGPDGGPAQYGQMSLLGIGSTGDAEQTAAARQFVEFWLSDGYLDWLSTSPEGKLPMRRGTADNASAYVDGWKALPAGPQGEALGDAYALELLDRVVIGAEGFDRWGLAEGRGDLAAALTASLPAADAVANVLDGDDVEDAIDDLVAAVEEELESLGE